MVQIGNVELKLEGESRPELVPVGFGLAEEEGQEAEGGEVGRRSKRPKKRRAE